MGIVGGDDCLSHLELLPEHRGGLELLEQFGNRWTLLPSIKTGRSQEQNKWKAKAGDHRSEVPREHKPNRSHTLSSIVPLGVVPRGTAEKVSPALSIRANATSGSWPNPHSQLPRAASVIHWILTSMASRGNRSNAATP